MGTAAPSIRAAMKALPLLTLCAMSLCGCKVLTIDENRAFLARQNNEINAASYVNEIWSSKATPLFQSKAVPARTLFPEIEADLAKAGAKWGRKTGEGSAWTFVVAGEGQVKAIDAISRRGTATVNLANTGQQNIVTLQIGPVVAGTAIRDALPFVSFNDFPGQLAFADVGRELTTKAFTSLKPALARLRVDQRIRFVGVLNLREAEGQAVITPISITPIADL